MTTTSAPRPDTAPARALPAAQSGLPTASNRPLRIARLLSLGAAAMIAVAAAAGLWADGLYQDAEPVVAMYRGYDLIALAIVAPLLAATSVKPLRERVWAQLVWLGLLHYAVYNYGLYLFGMSFNAMLLVHVTIFTLALYSLALGLGEIAASGLAGRFRRGTPVRTVAAILAVLAVSLGAMWVISAVRFAITSEVPEEASQLVLPTSLTHLGYVLDLTLLVPAYAVAAVLLWRRRTWGYALAAPLLLSGVVHQIGYMVALPFQVSAAVPGATAFDPIEPVIALLYVVAAGLLLGGTRAPRSAV